MPLTPGTRLGGYEIVGPLGAGGMGEVHRAKDLRLRRDVALKLLAPEFSDPARLDRFQREAETVAGLSHPNIVHLYSVEESDGLRFLTMELVEGEGLDRLIGPEGLPVPRVLEIGAAIADALAAAHARGIVHRDVKPSNVMVSREGYVKVLDFGVARPSDRIGVGEDAPTRPMPLTEAGSTLGTVPYMSPEQLRGGPVDHRSDLFSLGVLLHELATGRRPFPGPTNADLVSQILREPAPALTDLQPGLPSRLAALVARCLSKDAADRPDSASGVRDELRALTAATGAGPAEPGAPPGAPRPAPGPRRGRRGLALVATGVVLLVLAVAAFAYMRYGRPGSRGPTAIAVLPFTNVGAGEEGDFFTAGVHEDVTARLGALRDLRVSSRAAVVRVTRDTDDPREIARRLGARYLVEGSVRRSGSQVRVTAQLVDPGSRHQLWSASFDREVRDVFALQSEIAREIAGALDARISRSERTRLDVVPTRVMSAYDDYLRARDILNSGPSYERLRQAIDLLSQATRADDRFVEAWALLSQAHGSHVERLREFDGREVEVRAATAESEAALARARALAPDHVATLKAAGKFQFAVARAPVDALRSLDRALQQSPNDAETLLLQAQICLGLKQVDQARALAERAYAVDAGNRLTALLLASMYEIGRRYADLVPLFERLLALEPERTHFGVQAAYYRFLSDGSLASYRAFEEAVKSVDRGARCDLRTVQNREMVVAMFADEFEAYDRAWTDKWTRHYAGHGDWACPGQINDEANHAHLLLAHGQATRAKTIIERAQRSTMRPFTENSLCIFDRDAFRPKLDLLSGDSALARRAFDESAAKILANDEFPRGAVEKAVLLETADMVAPDRVYALYRQLVADPATLVSLETICANPWTYPNLLKDPRFVEEVRRDGRFVAFLGHFGLLPRA